MINESRGPRRGSGDWAPAARKTDIPPWRTRPDLDWAPVPPREMGQSDEERRRTSAIRAMRDSMWVTPSSPKR